MAGKQVSVNLYDIDYPIQNTYSIDDVINLYQAMPLGMVFKTLPLALSEVRRRA